MDTAAPSAPNGDAHDDSLRSRRGLLFGLLVAAAFLYSIGMARIGFEGQDERRYSLVAKEIWLGHGAFAMHYLRELYPDKPPLYFWAQALTFELTGGPSPLGARIPLMLSALGALAFAFAAIRRIESTRIALIATVALGLSFRFVWSGRWGRLDTPMLTWTYASFWASAVLLFPKRGSAEARSESPLGVAMLAWVFAALAVLAKGPGALVWLGTIVAYAVVRRDFGVVRAHRPLIGFPILAAIVGAWLVPAMTIGGPEYYGPMFGTHVRDRLIGEVRHENPFWYFLPKIVTDPLPMAALLPVALWAAWRGGRRRDPATGERWNDGGRTSFVLTWLIFMFVFFSLPSGKRGMYILPLYPAIAILVARFLDAAFAGNDFLPRDLARLILTRHLWPGMAFAVVAGVAALVVPGTVSDFQVPPPLAMRILLFVALAGGGGYGIFALRKGELGRAVVAGAVATYCTFAILFGIYFPLNRDDSVPRAFGEEFPKIAGEDPEFALYGSSDRFTMYTPGIGIDIDDDDPHRAVAWMNAGPKRWLVAAEESLEELYEEEGPQPWIERGRWFFPEKDYDIVLLESADGGTP